MFSELKNLLKPKTLFDFKNTEKQRKLDKILDTLRNKYAKNMLFSLLGLLWDNTK